jgi:hypothetical protein
VHAQVLLLLLLLLPLVVVLLLLLRRLLLLWLLLLLLRCIFGFKYIVCAADAAVCLQVPSYQAVSAAAAAATF